MQNQGT